MRAKGTWVLLIFLISAIVVGFTLNLAFRDIFNWLQINNFQILGEGFRLSGLMGSAIAIVLAVFFGLFYTKSRRYVEECVIEFNKVAFPEWKETKVATFTVIIVSFIAAIILGVFDTTFSWLSHNNFFIP